MDKKVTNFGKWCRKLRIDKNWTMKDVAEKLGYRQNHITQIEQGKTNPSPEFLRKCVDVYKITEKEKADFFVQALVSSSQITLRMDKINIISKNDLAKLMAILIFNLEDQYPVSKEWETVTKVINRLKESINDEYLSYTVLRDP
jgi:transcriptional regulator with XRE-family HTH domain